MATQGQAQRYSAEVPLENGTHNISAYAVDQAGNIGTSSQALVTVVTSQNQASLADPAPGSAVNSATVDLSGFVHFQDTEGDGQVEILVDGVSQGTATLADTAAQATSWTKTVNLGSQGGHTLTLRASRTAGSTASPTRRPR